MAGGFVSHLECSATGERIEHDQLYGLSPAGAPLLVRYDLTRLANAVTTADLARRPADMWRYAEFLPLHDPGEAISLGEATTPLVPVKAPDFPGARLVMKDEGRLPTGSFKARGMSVAVSMARRFGRKRIAVPTAGNAGAAAAAYGARAGMTVDVFAPSDTPPATLSEIVFHGAHLTKVDGLINACAQMLRTRTAETGWHDLSTLAEPYRIEGKKTMGLELAEQLGWQLPDAIYYPTGGGTGFIGMWKAFDELQSIGWIGPERPRMVAVQTTGCAPLQRAWEAGLDHVATPWEPVRTRVHGVRVPKPLGDRLILKVIAESGGHATSVNDEAAQATRRDLARRQGLHLCAEGAICYAACLDDLRAGRLPADALVVLFNTASGLKEPVQ